MVNNSQSEQGKVVERGQVEDGRERCSKTWWTGKIEKKEKKKKR